MLVASKKAITTKWTKEEEPKREDWVEIKHSIYIMEKLTFSIRLASGKFKKYWKNRLDFISPLRSDFIE